MAKTEPNLTREHWGRSRGVLAAVLVVAIVAATLIISRLDLAAELSIIRGQLTTATAETDRERERRREAEQERDAAQAQVEACAEAARLGARAQRAFEEIQRGVEDDDQGTFGRGLLAISQIAEDWRAATDSCAQETAET